MVKQSRLFLGKLAVFPLILGAGLFLREAVHTAIDLRGSQIDETCTEYLDSLKTETYFKEVKKQMGLENEDIELVLKEASEKRPFNGLAEKLENCKYRITIYTPAPKTTIKHELSHIDDFVKNNYYISSNPNLFGWVASEIKAQNYSIKN